MPESHLIKKVKTGDIEGVRAILLAGVNIKELEQQGNSPLLAGIESDSAGPEILRLLLEFGAEVGPLAPGTLLQAALAKGNSAKLEVLISAGADLRDIDDSGYDALIHAVHGRDICKDPQLVDFIRLLVKHGVPLSGESKYGESGLSVLSHMGRFDAVKVLLDAGAPRALLRWTPLIEATALGTLEDIDLFLREGAALEDRDRWDRSAWLVAVQMEEP